MNNITVLKGVDDATLLTHSNNKNTYLPWAG